MGFTLGEIATAGLPVGEHVIRVDDIEASVNSAKTNETIVFKTVVAQTESPKVKVGQKHTWSYTYMEQWRSIIANDLLRAGLPKELHLEGEAKPDAITLGEHMRGKFYVIAVKAQKKDPTNFNTSIVRPFAGQQMAPPPPPAAAPAPSPVAAPGTVGAAIPPPGLGAVPPPAVVPAASAPPIMAAAAAPAFAVPPPLATAPAATAAPAPVAAPMPSLDAGLIQAVQLASQGGGAFPPLNAVQIAQLDEIGMGSIAAMYRQAANPTPPPPPAAAPALTAFESV